MQDQNVHANFSLRTKNLNTEQCCDFHVIIFRDILKQNQSVKKLHCMVSKEDTEKIRKGSRTNS